MDSLALEQQSKGFDRLARGYDLLVALVYGSSLRKAQSHYLDRVKEDSKVLIVGGGTGWFLEALLRTGKIAEVTYVELSGKMLSLSRERIEKRLPQLLDRVEWIQGTVHDLPVGRSFDLVCTLCYLDLFEGEQLEREALSVRNRLSDKGNWYYSDFCFAKRWPMSWISRGLIWIMYRFFRMLCRIPAGKLENLSGAVAATGMESQGRKAWYGGMIE